MCSSGASFIIKTPSHSVVSGTDKKTGKKKKKPSEITLLRKVKRKVKVVIIVITT